VGWHGFKNCAFLAKSFFSSINRPFARDMSSSFAGGQLDYKRGLYECVPRVNLPAAPSLSPFRRERICISKVNLGDEFVLARYESLECFTTAVAILASHKYPSLSPLSSSYQ
jgi:hypothetical protein